MFALMIRPGNLSTNVPPSASQIIYIPQGYIEFILKALGHCYSNVSKHELKHNIFHFVKTPRTYRHNIFQLNEFLEFPSSNFKQTHNFGIKMWWIHNGLERRKALCVRNRAVFVSRSLRLQFFPNRSKSLCFRSFI